MASSDSANNARVTQRVIKIEPQKTTCQTTTTTVQESCAASPLVLYPIANDCHFKKEYYTIPAGNRAELKVESNDVPLILGDVPHFIIDFDDNKTYTLIFTNATQEARSFTVISKK